ncbi:hypothetical protein G9A89_009300 [Geosiphon pyriformis]|nr:hypothetical protein G9A89_009300 [Geosiphon pyriformis]
MSQENFKDDDFLAASLVSTSPQLQRTRSQQYEVPVTSTPANFNYDANDFSDFLGPFGHLNEGGYEQLDSAQRFYLTSPVLSKSAGHASVVEESNEYFVDSTNVSTPEQYDEAVSSPETNVYVYTPPSSSTQEHQSQQNVDDTPHQQQEQLISGETQERHQQQEQQESIYSPVMMLQFQQNQPIYFGDSQDHLELQQQQQQDDLQRKLDGQELSSITMAQLSDDLPSLPSADTSVPHEKGIRKRKASEVEGDEISGRNSKVVKLEQNRAAAKKSREKKKHHIEQLVQKAEDLEGRNTRLKADYSSLKEEISNLKLQLLTQNQCGCGLNLAREYLQQRGLPMFAPVSNLAGTGTPVMPTSTLVNVPRSVDISSPLVGDLFLEDENSLEEIVDDFLGYIPSSPPNDAQGINNAHLCTPQMPGTTRQPTSGMFLQSNSNPFWAPFSGQY